MNLQWVSVHSKFSFTRFSQLAGWESSHVKTQDPWLRQRASPWSPTSTQHEERRHLSDAGPGWGLDLLLIEALRQVWRMRIPGPYLERLWFNWSGWGLGTATLFYKCSSLRTSAGGRQREAEGPSDWRSHWRFSIGKKKIYSWSQAKKSPGKRRVF